MRMIRPRSPAFTLIELMISITIVISMMIGVNYVFSSVGQSTGLTQAVSRITRDAQGAQAVMARDFGTADMANAPFIMLRSLPVPAFRNRDDYNAAIDNANPMVYVDPNDESVLRAYSLVDVNNRVHRADMLTFFARDRFARQTGGGTLNNSTPITPYLSDMVAQEAMITYGHLWLPDNDGTFTPHTGPVPSYPNNPPTYPGHGNVTTNPNNFLANQWILGRSAILLQAPEQPSNDVVTRKYLRNQFGSLSTGSLQVEQWHIRGNTVNPLAHPVRYDAIAEPAGTPSIMLQNSRYDLAGTNMALLTEKFQHPLFTPPAMGHPWWRFVMGFHRYQARSFGLASAGSRLSPADVAFQTPIFLANCSQFVVEFAGDFISQDQNGSITGNTKDGTLDFHVIGTGVDAKRSVRWYGFPRDADGDGDIIMVQGDVVPVRDARGSPARFEREDIDTYLPRPTGAPDAQDYASSTYLSGLPASANYICGWGQGANEDRPQMFRIILALDDPNGRFADPLMFEYVFRLP